MPDGRGEPCTTCRELPPAYSVAHAVGRHEPPLSEAVYALKYRRRTVIADRLAGLAVDVLPERVRQCRPTVVAVPSHPRRRRERGVDPPHCLAAAVARRLDTTYARGLLRRHRHTPPQVGRDRGARRRNVAGAFRLDKAAPLDFERRPVLLVDDVLTTGSTVDACSRVLVEAGATQVEVVAISHAGR